MDIYHGLMMSHILKLSQRKSEWTERISCFIKDAVWPNVGNILPIYEISRKQREGIQESVVKARLSGRGGGKREELSRDHTRRDK